MENLLINFFNFILLVLGDVRFVFFVTIVAFVLKFIILGILISKGIRNKKIQQLSWFLIFFVLIGSMTVDLAWLVKLAQILFFPSMDYRILIFALRIAWAFTIVQYQSLALFIEVLIDKNSRVSFVQKIFLTLSGIGFVFFVFDAFYGFSLMNNAHNVFLEDSVLKISIFYSLFLVIPYSIFKSFYNMRKFNVPRIIKKQAITLIKFLILPILIVDIIQTYFASVLGSLFNLYATVGVSTLLITYAMFHCMRKIMGLRFLNIQSHVTELHRFDFINDFKNIIDQLSQAISIKELEFILQNFFKEAFDVPSIRVHLHVRSIDKLKNFEQEVIISDSDERVERFLKQYEFREDIIDFFIESKVLIIDELDFTNFYEKNGIGEEVFNFMNEISADIFIPLFDKKKIIAYIVVERFARIGGSGEKAGKFYSDVEHDQMVIFANYLKNVIKLLQSKNLNFLITQIKELKEELYLKHQENNQYKESIRSFLRYENQKEIGIVFYKNDRFSFGNHIANELVSIKLNTYPGHPITKKLKKMACTVIEYGAAQSCFIINNKGEKLVASGILHIDKTSVIISIRYPEVSDVLKQKIEFIKDPTKLDYLLYLETTKSGKLIDKLIPGNSETLLTYKVDLLKIALSKKAILIDIPEHDLLQTVEILHSISLRENLHILDLKKPSSDSDTAIKLFGINSIFGIKSSDEKPLLERLDNNGTLFIKNINYLEMETQKYLADFIKYGFFRELRGDKKTFSDVRIICSTNIDLKLAVENSEFSHELFGQLRNTSISMPTLMLFSEKDIDSITTSFADQVINNYELSDVLELTDRDKQKIAQSKPVSFSEIKNKIQNIMEKKSQNTSVHEKVQLIPSSDSYDQQVMEAIRLGKRALKDEKIMRMLWTKFENQNKIATLLGVNRSSINRRCKEYNII